MTPKEYARLVEQVQGNYNLRRKFTPKKTEFLLEILVNKDSSAQKTIRSLKSHTVRTFIY